MLYYFEGVGGEEGDVWRPVIVRPIVEAKLNARVDVFDAIEVPIRADGGIL